jgi:hypothetical protein
MGGISSTVSSYRYLLFKKLLPVFREVRPQVLPSGGVGQVQGGVLVCESWGRREMWTEGMGVGVGGGGVVRRFKKTGEGGGGELFNFIYLFAFVSS